MGKYQRILAVDESRKALSLWQVPSTLRWSCSGMGVNQGGALVVIKQFEQEVDDWSFA